MTPHLSLWYSHNVRIYFVKFDAESHLVYWPMIFDFLGGWTTKYKEIKITFMSNNIMWCLFWNPAVGWIGVFCGPDPAYGPPVDDHCFFSSFWVFVCGLFQRDTTWTTLFCSCWFLGQESSTLLFPVHVLCIIKGLSLPCKCVAFDFSFNGFLSHVGLHLYVAVYEKKKQKKQKRKKSDFKNSVVTESFFPWETNKVWQSVLH